jgi:hypothetical protein
VLMMSVLGKMETDLSMVYHPQSTIVFLDKNQVSVYMLVQFALLNWFSGESGSLERVYML